jgi:hypothetical protein
MSRCSALEISALAPLGIRFKIEGERVGCPIVADRFAGGRGDEADTDDEKRSAEVSGSFEEATAGIEAGGQIDPAVVFNDPIAGRV